MIYEAYFERHPETIDGVFTLHQIQNNKAQAVVFDGFTFERMPARSGQRGWTETSWLARKSPLPYGLWYLWLDAPNQIGQFQPGVGQIGQFFQISSDPQNRHRIKNPAGSEVRIDCGLHPENPTPGSLGCIALLVDSPQKLAAVKALFRFLQILGQTVHKIQIDCFEAKVGVKHG